MPQGYPARPSEQATPHEAAVAKQSSPGTALWCHGPVYAVTSGAHLGLGKGKRGQGRCWWQRGGESAQDIRSAPSPRAEPLPATLWEQHLHTTDVLQQE